MKKVIVLVLIIIFSIGNICFCEELPKPGRDDTTLSSVENPVYYKYMNDYAMRLKYAFEKSGYKRNHMGTSYEYVIQKDGTIKDLKRDLWDSKKLTDIVRKIIIDNPPPPFAEGMDADEFNVDLFIGNEDENEYTINYYSKKNLFRIIIVSSRKSN